jgi:hypothetical protein
VSAAFALLVLLQAPAASSPVPVNRFADAACGVTLTLPTGWQAAKIEAPFDATKCAFGLRPAGWLADRKRSPCETGEWAIYLSVYRGRLGNGHGLLVEQDGTLMIEGRAGMKYGVQLSAHPAGKMARGQSEVGCYGPDEGGYQGSAQAEVAYVESRGRTFEFVSAANTSALAIKPFDQIVRSLRVAAPPRRRSPAP